MLKWYLPFAVLVAILLVTVPGYAITPERGLHNPVFLTEMDDAHLAYVAYDLGGKELLLSYSEYDEYAQGYGALIIRTGGEDLAGGVSFIGVKEYGDFHLGLGIHRFVGLSRDWLLDLGASYQVGSVSGRLGLHGVPFTRWKDILQETDLSVGASVQLGKPLILGIDAWPLDKGKCSIYLLGSITKDLVAGVNIVCQDFNWSTGMDVWYARKSLLLQVGYCISSDQDSSFRFGVGVKF